MEDLSSKVQCELCGSWIRKQGFGTHKAKYAVTAVRSYPLDQDLINWFDETVDDKSDVYRLPDIKDESASRIELSVKL
ncbi:hypothetical protein BDZ94DRAFT_1259733 [Collybia nuda]|uniref:Uncharacterized protein n=1 Tax=Collybia nuda TaxID=64659 RepID=A0A9P5Y6M1_9AGAR|nr:hypothetical protein BDZ94DRAFT_1259733 [Collybia nuda]